MKRFYTNVTFEAGQVLLDKKPVLTPAKQILQVPEHLSLAIIQEWQSQHDVIDPELMPLTQFICTVQDLGDAQAQEWARQIHAYLDGDYLLYPCVEPKELRNKHDATFLSLINTCANNFGVPLVQTEELVHHAQSSAAHQAIDTVMNQLSLPQLFCWQFAAAETGSTILGWHVVFQDTDIDALLATTFLDDIHNDSLASPDRHNCDPMLEKKMNTLRRLLVAARQYSTP